MWVLSSFFWMFIQSLVTTQNRAIRCWSAVSQRGCPASASYYRSSEAANICQHLNSLRTGASHLVVDPIIISVRTQNRYDFRTMAVLFRISAKDLRRREFSFGTGCLQSAIVNERVSAYLLCEIYQCIHPLNVIVRVKLNRTATISHLLTRRASRVVLMEASIEPVVTCCW